MPDETDKREIELTDRGKYVLPRALEISAALPDVPFLECLEMAQQEYDTPVQ